MGGIKICELIDFNLEENTFDYPDIYFTPQYQKIWQRNTNDGLSKIFIYKENEGKVFYPFLLRPCSNIKGSEDYDDFYEAISVYGYSGPIIEGNQKNSKLIKRFRKALNHCFKKHDIITELIRFHPLIKNHLALKNNNSIELLRDKSTVYIDLCEEEKILNNMSISTRNQVKQSLNNDLEIKFISNPSKEEIISFYDIYYKNMDKVNASNYYFFNLDFFLDTFKLIQDYSELALIYHENDLVSASIFLLYEDYAHYHLSGAKREALDLRVNNFLLFKAAKRYSQYGYKFLHLGGGIEDDDGLFNFKKGFAPDNVVDFYIGRKIHNKKVYDEIYEKRRKHQEIPTDFVLPHS